MPGNAHERLVVFFEEFPRLLEKLMSLIDPTREWRVPPLADSAVRTGAAVELHPDLFFADGLEGPWTGAELQRSIDKAKESTWPLMISLKNHQRKCAGDLIVITHKPAVAEWARNLTVATGPLGTRVQCAVVVVHLDDDLCERLLRSNEPIAGVIAAWSVHEGKDAHAVSVATRAIRCIGQATIAETNTLATNTHDPSISEQQAHDHELRWRMVSAILSFLTPTVAKRVIAIMRTERDENDPNQPRTNSWFDDYVSKLESKGKAEGKVEGKLEALRDGIRAVIEARGLLLSKRFHTRIDACTDLATLQTWHAKAVTAPTVAAIFRK